MNRKAGKNGKSRRAFFPLFPAFLFQRVLVGGLLRGGAGALPGLPGPGGADMLLACSPSTLSRANATGTS